MIQGVFSIVIGYLLGCLSPAALLSKLKKKDLRDNGTGNLGATNTMLVLGKNYGIAVMIFDVTKGYLSVKLAQRLFPLCTLAGLIAGCAAIVGHIFPFYLNFQGGKGLAALGGLVLGIDPILFPGLLILGLLMMFATNSGYAMPITAAVLFPILFALRSESIGACLIVLAIGALIVFQNVKTMRNQKNKEQPEVRDFVKNHLGH